MRNECPRSKTNQSYETLSLVTCMGVPLISCKQRTLRSAIAETNRASWWQSVSRWTRVMRYSRQEDVWLTVGDERHTCWLTAAANMLVSGRDRLLL